VQAVTQPNIASPRRTATLEIGGQDVVLAYADERAEYEALRRGAIVVDRSHRGRLRVFGEKSGEALTGLVTNDVLAMQPGQGRYAAALSSKGRIVADVRIFAGVASYLVDTSARAWPGLLGMVKKYVNPRVSGYRDDSHAIRDLGVFGVDARNIVAAVTGVSCDVLGALAPYGHLDAQLEDGSVTIARSPDIAIEGYELFVPFEMFDRVWERAVDSGATPAGLGAWEIARVEAGRVEWGIDIDESTIPQEANFDELDAISYTKGCYIGQEVVARVHFRGRDADLVGEFLEAHVVVVLLHRYPAGQPFRVRRRRELDGGLVEHLGAVQLVHRMADDDLPDSSLVFLGLLRKFGRGFHGKGGGSGHGRVFQTMGSVLKNSRSVARLVSPAASSPLMACASSDSSHAAPADMSVRATGRG
jgi:aminomethyltransferase